MVPRLLFFFFTHLYIINNVLNFTLLYKCTLLSRQNQSKHHRLIIFGSCPFLTITRNPLPNSILSNHHISNYMFYREWNKQSLSLQLMVYSLVILFLQISTHSSSFPPAAIIVVYLQGRYQRGALSRGRSKHHFAGRWKQ